VAAAVSMINGGDSGKPLELGGKKEYSE